MGMTMVTLVEMFELVMYSSPIHAGDGPQLSSPPLVPDTRSEAHQRHGDSDWGVDRSDEGTPSVEHFHPAHP